VTKCSWGPGLLGVHNTLAEPVRKGGERKGRRTGGQAAAANTSLPAPALVARANIPLVTDGGG